MPKDGQKMDPVPLQMVDDEEEIADDETYIVVGEAAEDVAFEVCEDLRTALDVREAMIEDGFTVRLFQAMEVEVSEDE
jgi:hypothetical protein